MISLGKVSRSTSRTLCPWRASSIAVGEPAQRAPTTIASYKARPMIALGDCAVTVTGITSEKGTRRREGGQASDLRRLVSQCRAVRARVSGGEQVTGLDEDGVGVP